MCVREPFAAVLDRSSPRHAVVALGNGSAGLGLEAAPAAARWLWLADLLHSEWGLTGRLRSAGRGGGEFETSLDLEFIANLCRRSAAGCPPSTMFWREVLEVTTAAATEQRNLHADAEYLALCAGNELATECVERPSGSVDVDGSCTVHLAFDALCVAAADASTARRWLQRALAEWERRRQAADVIAS